MKMYNLLKFTPFVVAIFLISCGGSGQSASESETSQKTKVRVEEVSLVPVDQISTFTATVEADKVNNIAPAMGGRIRQIYVDVGSYVKKGQVLVAMDAATFSQQETQVATLRRDYERYRELYEVGGIAKQQLDQLKTQLDIAQTALDNIEENTRLTSPINGVVTARNFDPGDVAAGMPILTVENINPVKVIIHVSESYYSNVSKGMPATITLDALPGEEFEGKASLVHPTLNPVSHTFPVEIEVSNAHSMIRPGMFARVTMNFGVNERPLVSDRAVLKQKI